MTTAYLVGGDDYKGGVHSYIWKLDFEKSPLKWEKVSNLLNRRYGHACTLITVRKEPYIMTVGGLSNAHMTYKAQVKIPEKETPDLKHLSLQITSSVELYNINSGRRVFTAMLPKPLHGGSLTYAGSRLIYFGGVDPYGEASAVAYEYIPRPSGLDFDPEKTDINSFWKEHPLNVSSRHLIAFGYSL